jgi:transcriptional regulator with XRE-family HTH domain
MTVNERIKFLIKTLNLSTEEFSDKIGVKEGTTRNYLYRNSTPNTEYIEKIYNSIDNISAEWLLTGEGEPFKNGRPNDQKMPYMSASHSQQNTNYNTASGNVVNGPAPGNPELEYLRERVRELEKQNTDLLTRLLGLIK